MLSSWSRDRPEVRSSVKMTPASGQFQPLRYHDDDDDDDDDGSDCVYIMTPSDAAG